jgi:hypothetical protein
MILDIKRDGITLESLLPSTNRRLAHDTRIHRRYSEYIPTANFLFIFFITKPYKFLNKLYLEKVVNV